MRLLGLAFRLSTAKLHSPLFVRCLAKKYQLPKSPAGIRKRASRNFRKPLRVMANTRVLSPGEVAIEKADPNPQSEWYQNLNIHLICPECKEVPPNLIEEFTNGDTVCQSCGLVLGERIVDTRSEWRTFSNDDQGNDDPSRVGDAANPLLNGSQLQTNISFGDGGRNNRDLHRAQNKATHDKTTKTLLAAYKQIGSLCEACAMPMTVADSAKHLFKMTEDAKAFKGKSQDAVIAGCIFIACRQNQVPRTFREIFALTKVSKKEIGRTFKALEKFLSEKTKAEGNQVTHGGHILPGASYKTTESTRADELALRFASRLSLHNRIGHIAAELSNRTTETGVIAGRSPLSAAAACIYMISHLMGDPRSPKQISDIVSVSDGTIRTAYKLLHAKREQLIDDEWLKKGGDMSKLPAA